MARTDGAVEVRQLRLDEPLRPAGTVAPVFVPAALEKPSTALSDLAGLIGNFKGYMDGEEDKKKKQADLEEANRYIKTPPAQRSSVWPDGPPDSVKNPGYGSVIADPSITDFQTFLGERMPNYNPEADGPIEDWGMRQASEFADTRPELSRNPNAQQAFLFSVSPMIQKARLEQFGMEQATKRQELLAGSTSMLSNEIKVAQAEGKNADEQVNAVFKGITELKEKTGIGALGNRDVAPLIYQLATEAASRGDIELADALMSTPRASDNGNLALKDYPAFNLGGKSIDMREQYPLLLDKAKKVKETELSVAALKKDEENISRVNKGDVDFFIDRMNQLEDKGGAEARDIQQRHNQAVVQREKIRAEENILHQHNLSVNEVKRQIAEKVNNKTLATVNTNGNKIQIISPTTGKPIDVSEDMLERFKYEAIRETAARDAADAARDGGLDPEKEPERYNALVEDRYHILLSQNGMKDEAIYAITSNLGTKAGAGNDGRDISNDIGALDKLMELTSEMPAYGQQYLGGSAENEAFFYNYRNLVAMDTAKTDAYQMASQIVRDMKEGNLKPVSITSSDFDNAYRNLDFVAGEDMVGADKGYEITSPWASLGAIGDASADPVLTTRFKKKLESYTNTLLTTGQVDDPKAAVKEAYKRLAAANTVYNGVLIPVGNLPPDMVGPYREALKGRIDGLVTEFTKGNPDASLKAEDIIPVEADGGAAFFLQDKRSPLMFVPDPKDPSRPLKIQRSELLQEAAPIKARQDEDAENQIIRKNFDNRFGLSWTEELGFNLNTTGGLATRRSMKYQPPNLPPSVGTDTDFVTSVNWVEEKFNMPQGALWKVMDFETGGKFDPATPNQAGSGATGLIQFTPEVAKEMGYTTKELGKMKRVDQMKVVAGYFRNKLGDNKNPTESDVYMAVLWPAAVGKPEDTVLFKKGSSEYKSNSGLDLDGNGSVTKAEYSKKVDQHLEQHSRVTPKIRDVGPPGAIVSSVSGEYQPRHFRELSEETRTKAQELSLAFGGALRITPNGGKSARASKHSQHVHGNAMDVYVADYDDAEKENLVAMAIAQGFTGIGGYAAGSGKGTVHIDTRKGKGNGPGGLAIWWRNRPGQDGSLQSAPAWFQNGVRRGLQMRQQASN